jgi:two-component sensor histidine kinase
MERPARVLYIDDDEGLRNLTARNLKRRGFEVEAVGSGLEGIAFLKERSADLVAIDHYMPGMDGLATLERLLAEVPSPPPVVYVTGSDESRIAVAALKAGAADYVVKSIGVEFFDLLATAFGQALERERLRRAAAEAEGALRASNQRLEALLKEVNHRVANSLQMVSAFVIMQGNTLADESAKAALRQTQQRILAIAQVHRKLYTSDDVETVDMVDYLTALLVDLEETWSTPASPRRLVLNAGEVRLKTDKAVAVGVIVNELVSNACKYAYDPAAGGEVRIHLEQSGDAFTLGVEDDGPGFDTEAVPRGTGLGRKLVGAMAATLRSEIDYARMPSGFRISLRAAV